MTMPKRITLDRLRVLVQWAGSVPESLVQDLSVEQLDNLYTAVQASDWLVPLAEWEPWQLRQAWTTGKAPNWRIIDGRRKAVRS